MALRDLGLVKVTRASAAELFRDGIPFIIIGNNVNSYHFFGGWHLGMTVDPSRYHAEGWDFDHLVGNWSQYNENPETGKASFFVDKKFLAR